MRDNITPFANASRDHLDGRTTPCDCWLPNAPSPVGADHEKPITVVLRVPAPSRTSSICQQVFCELAAQVEETLPSNPEKTVALRKLLEAEDCAVRAVLLKDAS
jgi:hypothetical protein